MESFFLSETTKYLYLLFDHDNFLNNNGASATIINTPNGECIIDSGGYIFNTEAHPVDPSALRCCHDRYGEMEHELSLNICLIRIKQLKCTFIIYFQQTSALPS